MTEPMLPIDVSGEATVEANFGSRPPGLEAAEDIETVPIEDD